MVLELPVKYRQNLADNASYVAPPLDGNGTQLIVETKSPTTKNNKAFPMLCELALLGFDFYGKRSTWTTAHPKGDQPLLYYSADSKTPANELRDYIVERGKGLWAFQPELAETLPA